MTQGISIWNVHQCFCIYGIGVLSGQVYSDLSAAYAEIHMGTNSYETRDRCNE